MKKLLLSSALVIGLGFSFTSCRETEKKTDEPSVIVIEKKADDTPKKTEGAMEKAGRAIDNAAKEVKEAGKAVDNAAKEVVGDDN
ncbi:MAG: hypothetical protein WA749_05265 [Gelidibacter sp.]